MPRGRPRKKKIEIPPEGWGRCADCVAKSYETWVFYLNKATTPNKVTSYESIMQEHEKIIDRYIKRSKADTTFDPKENGCICCIYDIEYKDEIESGKMPVVTTMTEFKKLCRDIYMKSYKKVSDIPITKRRKKKK